MPTDPRPTLRRRRRPVRRLTAAALASAVALLLVPAGSGGASAAITSVTVSRTAPVGGADFATEAYGDPWDFSNASDLVVVPRATTADMDRVTLTGGRLVADARTGGYVSPVVSWDDLGAVPWGRDGSLLPVDAGRFTRMSVHMNVDRAGTSTLMWFTCGVAVPSCQGTKGFTTTAGWRTYDVPLTSGSGGQPWRGLVEGLRFYPADRGGHAEVDWIRLYAPGETVTVSFAGTPGGQPTLIWDADTNAANNTAASPAWGRLDATGTGSSRTVQAGALPSGTYRIGFVDGGRTTYASAPMVVDAPPAPQVLDPDRAGGMDYATLAGNPWDFDDPGDVFRVGNATSSLSGGALRAQNAGRLPNDPHLILSQYGPIDGSRFHRLSVRMRHEGGWGLEDAPDAGMNARIVWTVPSAPELAQVSDDLVVYPGTHTVSLDMATNPPNAVQEPGDPGQAGWAGQQLLSLRIDPNEDPGPRRWAVEDVRLAEDDTAYGGAFDIRFRDLDWRSGTTATVRADTDRTGCDGTVVASGVRVQDGVNTVRWAPRPVPSGTYWVCVQLSDGRRTTNAYATGPLVMTTRPSPAVAGGSPRGSVDSVRRVPGGLAVSGWALDPDTTGPSQVHVYVGGRGVSVRADDPRPDVGNANPGFGPEHGFSVTVPTGPGTHQVCVHAINVGVGRTTTLRCAPVTVSSTPFGRVDAVTPVPGGLQVRGWAIDPDTAAPIDVHSYVGRSGAATTADAPRPDVGRVHPGYGAAHGFSRAVPVTAGGAQPVCTYGINVGPGAVGLLGCRTVPVAVAPTGSLDVVRRVPGGVRVAGWTLDPSTANPVQVHVYVGSAGTSLRADAVRDDVARAYPAWGPRHGFDRVLAVPSGPVQVCAYAINQGPGTTTVLGCRTV